MKLAAGAFLAGATSRLLPASIPFRYFGAAVAYHLLAWIALLPDAGASPRFTGGLGWRLAALHLVTLGVLVMSAMGASLQLLPIATRQPVRFKRAPAAIWWLYTPGVGAIALGMGTGAALLLVAGATAVAVALLAYAALIARNLLGAKGMPAVTAHCWVALASLLVTLVTALSLACTYLGAPLVDRGTALALHVAFAPYGFMGMLVLGLSYILIPMFALSAGPDVRNALLSCAFGVAALLLAAAAALGVVPPLARSIAIALAGVAVALHLLLMRTALRTGMRRGLGRSFRLVRMAWALLVASLIVALGVALGAPMGGIATLFGLLVIVGWLLSFLLGILQRIVPFLGAMHAARGRKPAPTPSALTAARPLAVHFWCHVAALALLALAILTDGARLAFAAALVGATGAAAFAVFFVGVIRRMRRQPPPSQARVAQIA